MPSLTATARKLIIFGKGDDISGETKLLLGVERADGLQSVSVWGGGVKKVLLLLALMLPPVGRAQDFVEKVQPRATSEDFLITKARGLSSELRATARDFATFRDPKWQALTLAQIAAATADGATSLHNLHRCSYCQEIGSSRLVIGRHPDAHKYMLAGLVEISVEAVAAHYLHHHGPVRKWYWRYAWTLPQSFSLAEHTLASFHNANAP